jgi:hypothetical protein
VLKRLQSTEKIHFREKTSLLYKKFMIDVSGVSPTPPGPKDDFKHSPEILAHQLRQTLGSFVHKLNELDVSALKNPDYLNEVATLIQKIHQLTSRG